MITIVDEKTYLD